MKSKNNNGTSSPAPIKVGAGGGITGGINRGGGWGSGNGQGQVNRNLMGGVSPRGGDPNSPYKKIGGKNPSSNGLVIILVHKAATSSIFRQVLPLKEKIISCR